MSESNELYSTNGVRIFLDGKSITPEEKAELVRRANAYQEWIAGEILPEDSGEYLIQQGVYGNEDRIRIGSFWMGEWNVNNVHFWQPLPPNERTTALPMPELERMFREGQGWTYEFQSDFSFKKHWLRSPSGELWPPGHSEEQCWAAMKPVTDTEVMEALDALTEFDFYMDFNSDFEVTVCHRRKPWQSVSDELLRTRGNSHSEALRRAVLASIVYLKQEKAK